MRHPLADITLLDFLDDLHCIADQRTLWRFAHLCQLGESPFPLPHEVTRQTQCDYIEDEQTGAAAVAFVSYRHIVIVIRGTELRDVRDLRADANINRLSYSLGGQVHAGFLSQAQSLKQPILDFAQRIRRSSPQRRSIYLTGHSLGGAVATVLADYLLADGLITFGSPRVGDREFAERWNGRHGREHHHRVVHGNDIVPRVPMPLRYRHCGCLFYLDRQHAIRREPQWLDVLIDRVLGFRFDLLRDHSLLRYMEALA